MHHSPKLQKAYKLLKEWFWEPQLSVSVSIFTEIWVGFTVFHKNILSCKVSLLFTPTLFHKMEVGVLVNMFYYVTDYSNYSTK